MGPIVFALKGHEPQAKGFASALKANTGELEIKSFPDKESYIRVISDVQGKDIIVYGSLAHPDPLIPQLLFLSRTLQDLGARSIHFVCPYFPYLRQDHRFHEGEALSSHYFGELISQYFSSVTTLDPHLHRIQDLGEVLSIPFAIAHSGEKAAHAIKEFVKDPVLIGPDSESEQWVAEVAHHIDVPYTILEKERISGKEVNVTLKDPSTLSNGTPVLVDDIISSGGTMIQATKRIRESGKEKVHCFAVHGIFAEDAYGSLLQAGMDRILTTNSIPHASNSIDITSVLAEAFQKIGK